MLGDDAAAPRHVETVQGRGYRFVAELQPARLAENVATLLAE